MLYNIVCYESDIVSGILEGLKTEEAHVATASKSTQAYRHQAREGVERGAPESSVKRCTFLAILTSWNHNLTMSLRDLACYTLSLVPSLRDPNVIELVEKLKIFGKEESRYVRVKEKIEGEAYSAAIYGEQDLIINTKSFKLMLTTR